MPDAHIFHHTNYISGVKNLLNVNLLQYPFYYPIKINFLLCFEDGKKAPHKHSAYWVILFRTIAAAQGVYSFFGRLHLTTYSN